MTRGNKGADQTSDAATSSATLLSDSAEAAAASGDKVVVRSSGGSGSAGAGKTSDTAMSGADTHMVDTGGEEAADAPALMGDADSIVSSVLAGRYLVTRKIGQGGMGAVFEATHTLIGKRVAVKVLLDKYAQKDAVVARLKQEAQLASSIGHEHIIDITDFGQTNDGRTFVVMEYLEGEPLSELLSREGPLPEERILRITAQIASALGAAHAKGVVHRDVKPENIFLLTRNERDFVKVVDFGISKSMRSDPGASGESPRLTQTGMVLGTPLYMSPEQARGDDELDHRIDIYALGVIMYELATGEVPFHGNNYLSVISQVLNDDPVMPRERRPELSEELEAVILRAMAKDCDDRYADAAALLQDVNALLSDPLRTTARARISAPKRRSSNKSRTVAWIAVGAAIAATAATAAFFIMRDSKTEKVPAAMLTPIDAGVVAVAPTDAPPPPPIEPAVEVVVVKLLSEPPGATIYQGGRILGTTPTEWRGTKNDDKADLIAELEGYDDSTFTIDPVTDANREVAVRLKKVKKGSKAIKLRKDPPKVGPTNDTKPHVDDTAGGDLTGNPYER